MIICEYIIKGNRIYDAAVVFAGASLLTGVICYPGIFFTEGRRRHNDVTHNDVITHNDNKASTRSKEIHVQVHEL